MNKQQIVLKKGTELELEVSGELISKERFRVLEEFDFVDESEKAGVDIYSAPTPEDPASERQAKLTSHLLSKRLIERAGVC